jgi:hypothetical protein
MQAQPGLYIVLYLSCLWIGGMKRVPVNPLFEWAAQLPVGKPLQGHLFNARLPGNGQWAHPNGELHFVSFPELVGSPVEADNGRRRGDCPHASGLAVKCSHLVERSLYCKTMPESHGSILLVE